MKQKKKGKFVWIGIILGIAFLGLLGRFICFKLFEDPYRGTTNILTDSEHYDTVLTQNEAIDDINYVIDKLRTRHPAWLEESNSRVSEVEARYEMLSSEINDSITVMELHKKLGYMLNPLHDGHTYIYYRNQQLMIIDDTSYLKQYGRPTHINGEPVEKVINRYLSYESYEIEECEIAAFFANPICFEADMQKLDVDTSEGVTYTYMINGVATDIHHTFIPYKQAESTDAPEEYKWVYFDIDQANNTGVFTLRECINNKEYKETVKEFFTQVAEKHIENVVVDLRDNGGGNSGVANEFLRYINVDEYKGWDSDVRKGNHLIKNRNVINKNKKLQPQFTGDLYVITNSRTYSAAKDFTMYIMDNQIGVVVGEASANLADTYGDCLYFQLPHSKLQLSVSYKRWYRIDRSKAGLQLIPDYPCEPEYALEKVYELIGD